MLGNLPDMGHVKNHLVGQWWWKCLYWLAHQTSEKFWNPDCPPYCGLDLSKEHSRWRQISIDPSHKSHNASDKYPTMHHFVLLQNGALCDTGLVHCEIWDWCNMGFVQQVFWYMCIKVSCSLVAQTHSMSQHQPQIVGSFYFRLTIKSLI